VTVSELVLLTLFGLLVGLFALVVVLALVVLFLVSFVLALSSRVRSAVACLDNMVHRHRHFYGVKMLLSLIYYVAASLCLSMLFQHID